MDLTLLKASAIGSSVTIIIDGGKLVFGKWQGVYFCEFDPPRSRKFYVKISGGIVLPMDEKYNKAIEKIREKTPRMAICYDFDKTLSPDDMQTFTLIPSLGMDKSEFWAESNKLAIDNLMDNNLAWMYKLINKSNACNKSISKDYFHRIGNDVKLYKGVAAWFRRINKFGEKCGLEIQHYIISSGLKELIAGSKIAHEIKRIYASSYYYSIDGIALWPAQAVNYTNKTQFIFRIAKGIFEEYDDSVNDSMSDEDLYIPYENIIYIGDSVTDIPCMRLVKSKGGYAIGVYDPEKTTAKRFILCL